MHKIRISDGSMRYNLNVPQRQHFTPEERQYLLNKKAEWRYPAATLQSPPAETLRYGWIVIPVRNRSTNLAHTLLNLCSMLAPGLGMVVVEHDASPHNRQAVLDQGCSYIHIPCSSETFFSKSLCLNTAYRLCHHHMAQDAYWVCHDVDLVMSTNFVASLCSTIDRHHPTHFQCFGKKAVVMMSPAATARVRSHVVQGTGPDATQLGTLAPSFAPGGSVCIRNDLFEQVGGFDAELFTRYATEDACMWIKLERLLERKPFRFPTHCPQRLATANLEDVCAYHQHHDCPPVVPSTFVDHAWIGDFFKYASAEWMEQVLASSQAALQR
jgi:hypothetical protein